MTLVKFNNKTRNTAPYFNNVFDSLFSDALNKNQGINKIPNVNICENENEYKIELAAPGLNKEDFKIDLKKDNLSVWAEKKIEADLKKDYTRKEFEYNSFARSFILPEGVDAEKISAEYVNGILTITIGKQDEAKNTHKEIVVS
ncbi:Hsp20/alpha crystallin family protein [Pedobacter cryotolerans]|uniref:Hsp20/alpha crystallin family protein n=1 Tax=Pedobacter cryotolerans TaxID=2571270 RepID=A0A4U1C8D3_9SPHI|nr:Hsp20/alpha crystallin family protein [Pedobacter cryotolerans]TKC02576.1 Hsp20/alpha crystallin family protein [Pedobacter cryotolerans]